MRGIGHLVGVDPDPIGDRREASRIGAARRALGAAGRAGRENDDPAVTLRWLDGADGAGRKTFEACLVEDDLGAFDAKFGWPGMSLKVIAM